MLQLTTTATRCRCAAWPASTRSIRPGDLCFDVGAHVGSRVRAWTRLGAQVVAVEPQPSCVQSLRLLYGRNRRVAIVDQALGAEPGRLTMRICRREPPVSSLSLEWMERVKARPNFAAVRWDAEVLVRVTTLDALIERFGEPTFCKIDVEGFELEVLRGLSRPLRSLSFEYVPGAIDMALACFDHLAELGDYEYNVSPGESMRLAFPDWVEAGQLTRWLSRLLNDDLPGDIYARLVR
jgi:FkbM family methyltransferase